MRTDARKQGRKRAKKKRKERPLYFIFNAWGAKSENPLPESIWRELVGQDWEMP